MSIDLTKKYTLVDNTREHEKQSLKDILSTSEYTLLYFYPKNDTPGCTVENTDFTNFRDMFVKKGIQVLGVSRDSTKSHKDFIEKFNFVNALISDPNLDLHKELGAFGEKNNYGKIVEGVIRSTFLLDTNGNIIREWRNVKAKGHVEKVLRELDV